MSMFDIETIQTPYGLCVSGSASVKGSPDSALITASINQVEQKPPDAFSKAKEGARAVGNFLRESGVDDFGTSRIWLDEKWGRGEHRDMSNFLGHTASVRFMQRYLRKSAARYDGCASRHAGPTHESDLSGYRRSSD